MTVRLPTHRPPRRKGRVRAAVLLTLLLALTAGVLLAGRAAELVAARQVEAEIPGADAEVDLSAWVLPRAVATRGDVGDADLTLQHVPVGPAEVPIDATLHLADVRVEELHLEGVSPQGATLTTAGGQAELSLAYDGLSALAPALSIHAEGDLLAATVGDGALGAEVLLRPVVHKQTLTFDVVDAGLSTPAGRVAGQGLGRRAGSLGAGTRAAVDTAGLSVGIPLGDLPAGLSVTAVRVTDEAIVLDAEVPAGELVVS